jgi:hypothetical protein
MGVLRGLPPGMGGLGADASAAHDDVDGHAAQIRTLPAGARWVTR